jgi:hypothetical protein
VGGPLDENAGRAEDGDGVFLELTLLALPTMQNEMLI